MNAIDRPGLSLCGHKNRCFLRPDLSLCRYRNRCFLVALRHLMVQKIERGISDQELSLSAGKNTRTVLKPCRAWKYVPATVSGRVDIPFCLWVSFFTTDKLLVRFTKLHFWFYHIFYLNEIIMITKVRNPDNFGLHISQKLVLAILEAFEIKLLVLLFLLSKSKLDLRFPDSQFSIPA